MRRKGHTLGCLVFTAHSRPTFERLKLQSSVDPDIGVESPEEFSALKVIDMISSSA